MKSCLRYVVLSIYAVSVLALAGCDGGGDDDRTRRCRDPACVHQVAGRCPGCSFLPWTAMIVCCISAQAVFLP